MSRLIQRCLCGSTGPFREFAAPTGLPVAACSKCKTVHQVTSTTAAEVRALYEGEYHASCDRHPGCVPYAVRYEHDLAVSAQRWKQYHRLLNGKLTVPNFNALDVGAANGAWVDYLQKEHGLLAMGVDPDESMARDAVMHGRICDVHGEFSLITYHDVLEHVVDPDEELGHARGRLKKGGVLVVDVPDVFGGRGDHHFKAEHLWFFNEDSLRSLLRRADFRPFLLDRPVPGKLVAYGEAV